MKTVHIYNNNWLMFNSSQTAATEQDGGAAAEQDGGAAAEQDGEAEAEQNGDAGDKVTAAEQYSKDFTTPLEEDGYKWSGSKWVKQDYSDTTENNDGIVEGSVVEEGIVEEGVVEEGVVEEGIVEEGIVGDGIIEETKDGAIKHRSSEADIDDSEEEKEDSDGNKLRLENDGITEEEGAGVSEEQQAAALNDSEKEVDLPECELIETIRDDQIIFEHDISSVQEVIVEEISEDIDQPITTPAGPVIDPIEGNADQDQFNGWDDEDVDVKSAWADTLERIPHLDPHHTVSTLVTVNQMKGKELKKELKARGLATSGHKNKLINRLEAALVEPGKLNEDNIELQAGVYDSGSDTPKEDIGLLMERRKKKIKPEVEERKEKIWALLDIKTPVNEICKKIGCSRYVVNRIQKVHSGGKSVHFNFTRQQISQLLDAKVEPKEICRITNCSRSTVFWVKKQKKTGNNINTKYCGGKRTIRTPEFIDEVWATVCSDPSKKMRRIAKQIGVSRSTTRRAIREDLCLYPYKYRITQLIPKRARPLRVKRGNKLLKFMEENPDVIIIFSDEKTWDVDSAVNKQNDRFLAYCIQSVPEKHRTTRPSGAMMLGVCGSDGQVMQPLWIDKGTKVDSKVYIENLKKVKAWIHETYGDRPVVFQQDGAPSHISEETQAWMDQNFKSDQIQYWPADWWPPYSPDLNPLDYNIWGFVESRACANPHSSVSALQKSVDQAWKDLLTVEHVKKTCAAFAGRIRKMIAAKGNTFEPRKSK